MRKLTAFGIIVFMFGALLPSQALAAYATYRVISGATAAFDYVYSDDSNDIEDVTDEAADDDNDEFELFPENNEDEQYLYMGSKTIYDRIYFDVETIIEFEDDEGLKWEYRSEDNGWKELDLSADQVDDFGDEGSVYVSFNMPTDWDEYSFQSHKAYWVRVKPADDVDEPAEIEQISARAYTVYLDIEDDDNDEVDDLTSSDFGIDDATDETIYAVKNLKNGKYALAIQTEASDINYTLTIDDSRYDEKDVSVRASTDPTTYDVELEENGRSGDDDDDDDYDTPFIDLSHHWAKTEVEALYERDVVSGVSYYYYMPNLAITRAEFLKMVLLNADEDMDDYSNEDEPYKDVSSNDWFYDYVVAAYDLELITEARYFRPNEVINRAEAVTLLVRMADEATSDRWFRNIFDDVSSYAWYAKYVYTAWADNVVDGYTDGTFRPNRTLTRGEAAVMVDNAYEAWYD